MSNRIYSAHYVRHWYEYFNTRVHEYRSIEKQLPAHSPQSPWLARQHSCWQQRPPPLPPSAKHASLPPAEDALCYENALRSLAQINGLACPTFLELIFRCIYALSCARSPTVSIGRRRRRRSFNKPKASFSRFFSDILSAFQGRL